MPRPALGPLGTRLFLAFLLIAITAIGTLSAGALIGTQRGLLAQEHTNRQQLTDSIAAQISLAFVASTPPRSLASIDVSRIDSIADASSVRYIIRDPQGLAMLSYRAGNGMGSMMGMGQELSGRWERANIVVAGATIGTVSVGFETALTSTAQSIAWQWIFIAAVIALVLAFLLALFASRKIARPIRRISQAAQRFAAGDRTARTDPQDAAANWELGELARAFDSTAENVVRSETARRRISADVAHELRTPLSILQGSLEELRDGLIPVDTEQLNMLHVQAVRLGRIVDDLSSLAAAETAALSLDLQPADLGDIARAAFQEAKLPLAQAGIAASLDIQGSAPIRVDADRIHQAIRNLLSNAARYCRDGDRVTVHVHATPTLAVLRIEDSGPGVTDQELPHLFERLWRGSSASSVEGSGIGLAIVRELIEAQSGTVSAEHGSSGGLVFTIALPIQIA